MSKIYVLLKDAGNVKSGATSRLGEDKSHYFFGDDEYVWFPKEFVENNPSLFKEKITGLIGVNIIGKVVDYSGSASINFDEDGKAKAIAMDGKVFIPDSISKQKTSTVKEETMANAVNSPGFTNEFNDSSTKLMDKIIERNKDLNESFIREVLSEPNEKKYTEQDLQKAFEAGTRFNIKVEYEYQLFQDYLSSINSI